MTLNITTREVTIASHDGKSFGAYLAVPAAGHGPGLVLCQEIFGVNDFMRRAAQLLAEEGYVVLVPDLF
ncbi:dienelactone hydrolase family protein, partial [Achromobacter sp.]|uniref:dienelactone hydrolase family protein n=1 Tax=Achromobacter sp. TaxID=134375 RepID=UPI00391811D7